MGECEYTNLEAEWNRRGFRLADRPCSGCGRTLLEYSGGQVCPECNKAGRTEDVRRVAELEVALAAEVARREEEEGCVGEAIKALEDECGGCDKSPTHGFSRQENPCKFCGISSALRSLGVKEKSE